MATGFRNLTVYKKAFALAMDIYHVSKKFPKFKIREGINSSVFELPTVDCRFKSTKYKEISN